MINWLIALMLLHQPYMVSDVALLKHMPYEYAIVYNVDYTTRIETTDHSRVSVSIFQYSRIVRNGGHVAHTHTDAVCPTFSYQDVENAMLLNLADTEAVSRYQTYYAIRNIGGWHYFSYNVFVKMLNKHSNLEFCSAYDETWKELSKRYDFTYFSR